MPITAALSGASIDSSPANTKTMKGKNVLFMALVTGLAKEAKRKKDTERKAKAEERQPSEEVASLVVTPERDAVVNDIPTMTHNSSTAISVEHIPEISQESNMMHNAPLPPSQRTHGIPPPPPPSSASAFHDRNISTPSPGRYHKMLSINKLGKEEPTHQIQTKAYREKAYVGPRKAIIGPYQTKDGSATVTDVIQEETINIKVDDTFFAELKHRAALQNATQSLLAENKETVASIAAEPCNDEVSALGSNSFESEKTPKETFRAPPEAFGLECPPKQVQVQHTKPVELPVKYLDVLPDDEKKDIVIENMKNDQAPLPFDEKVEVTLTEYKTAVGHTDVASPVAESFHSADELAETKAERKEQDRIDATEDNIKKKQAFLSSEEKVDVKVGKIETLVSHADETSHVAESSRGSDELEKIKIQKTEADQIDSAPFVKLVPVDTGMLTEEHDNIEVTQLVQEKIDARESHTITTESYPKPELPATSSNSETSTKIAVASVKSCRMGSSPKSLLSNDEDNEARSFKSLPASFVSNTTSLRRDFEGVLEVDSCKTNRLGSVIESKGNTRVTTELSAENTVATEAVKGEDHVTIEADVGTELLEIEMGTEDVTKEANADVDDLSELGSTAISIKEITISSSAPGDRSTAIASISSKIEHQTRRLAELEAAALRKHKEAETAATDARVALEKMLEARSKEKTRKIDYYKREVTRLEEVKGGKTEQKKSAYEDCKSTASRTRYYSTNDSDLEKGDAEADFSLRSTWSEDDLKSTKLVSKLKSKGTADYDYQSIISAPEDVPDRGEVFAKSLTRTSGQLKVNSGLASSSLYSEASFSQYSRDVHESTRSDKSESYQSELASDAFSYASSYTEDIKVSEIKKKHGRMNSYPTSRNRRSSTTGRHRVQSTLSSRRSRSASPSKIVKKSLFLPSLMSPDPPSKQGSSSRQLNSRARQRSRSQPKNKFPERKSMKKYTTLSKTIRPKKSDYMAPYTYSPVNAHETVKTKNVLSAISPETRQPVLSTALQGSPSITQSYEHLNAFPMSLAGYNNIDSKLISHSRMEIPPHNGHQQYKQHTQHTPNSVPSAPISLVGYKSRDQPYFSQPAPTSQYSHGFANTSHSVGLQTPQQLVTHAIRPYSTGQLSIVRETQYHTQQHHAAFHAPAGKGRLNQYSMPTGGELI